MKPTLPEQRLIDYLNIHYALNIIKLVPLLSGADMNASTYKAQGKDQKLYFIKLKKGHNHEIGVTILNLLHDEGIEHIISPIKSSYGLAATQIEDYTLIVYPYMEHQNGFNQILTENQWSVLGKVLRKVHELKTPFSIQDQIRKEDFSPKWRNIVRSLYQHMDTKANQDPWAERLMIFIKKNKKEIDRLLNNADLLCEKIQPEQLKFVLCHADIHGGNVLINENGSIYIVDWEQPVMAPKERDLMFIGGGVANVWNHLHEEDFFYRGYGNTEVNMSILAYYRHERILEDIAEYSQEFFFKSYGEDKSEIYQHFIAMFEPRGVVDIAFSTSEKL